MPRGSLRCKKCGNLSAKFPFHFSLKGCFTFWEINGTLPERRFVMYFSWYFVATAFCMQLTSWWIYIAGHWQGQRQKGQKRQRKERWKKGKRQERKEGKRSDSRSVYFQLSSHSGLFLHAKRFNSELILIFQQLCARLLSMQCFAMDISLLPQCLR